MGNLHLRSLHVTAFRGIRDELALTFGRRLTILYGGNASGKSSLAQAIEFALSGEVLDQEDRPIPPSYLRHSRATRKSLVRLVLGGSSGEIHLNAAADESRSAIEGRFREAASVDWPDRQRLPVTQTHVTSQGLLARVLAADQMTRNDLAGLCAGAYLRSLVSRAERLANHFRQAATGRNMQADIKAANSDLDSARLLHQSLSGVPDPLLDSTTTPEELVSSLATEVEVAHLRDMSEIQLTLSSQLQEAEQKLQAIGRLLIRTRDLGQYEVELAQAKTEIASSLAAERELAEQSAQIASRLRALEAEKSALATQREQAKSTISTFEDYQKSAAIVQSLQVQLTQSEHLIRSLNEQISALDSTLQAASLEQRAKSDALVRLTTEYTEVSNRLSAATEAFEKLSAIPAEEIQRVHTQIQEYELALLDLRKQQETASAEVRVALEAEASKGALLRSISETEARFAAAAAELEALISSDACPLCAHQHGSQDALESAIREVREGRLSNSAEQKKEFEHAVNERRKRTSAYERIAERVRTLEASLLEEQRNYARLSEQRNTVLGWVSESLTRHGVQAEVSLLSLSMAAQSLATKLQLLVEQLVNARQVESETRQRRDDLEQELAERKAAVEQARRRAEEIAAQIEAIRRNQPSEISAEAASEARSVIAGADAQLAEVGHTIGGLRAELLECERRMTEVCARRSGAERRLESVEGLLGALDAELKQVGATREIAKLVTLEAETRQLRDRIAAKNTRIAQVREEITRIEQNRARVRASERLRAAQERLEKLQQRQQRLSKRANQFAELHRELEKAQSKTAEEVLKNVRAPVGLMFRAMTAGCQWDIEFGLAENGLVHAHLLNGMSAVGPATAMLNSAYLNVSAIALRIALASQQNWTNLRTVVLDDPILEMDSLTQSALLDGLEAIIASPHSPWTSLQFVLTTWSEDFAVLAAHKLAHLNTESGEADEFVIYRLVSRPDGSVDTERHVPRWRRQADAA